MKSDHTSWGLTGQKSSKIHPIKWRTDGLPEVKDESSLLAYGNGRSYGDSCLNKEGMTLDTKALNHLIAFDEKTHILRCEGGVLLADILENYVAKGWFVPVTPGTKFVTIGGAVANDVHGKNHHRRGSFGNHVIRLCLRRSNGETIVCSRTKNAELFSATIGGLGLTGLILWVDVLLMPIDSDSMVVETTKFENLDQFFELSKASEWKFEYNVAWIDCASSKAMGRGIFMQANHCSRSEDVHKKNQSIRTKSLPFNLPSFVVNNVTSKLFNKIYYNAHPPGVLEQIVGYNKFFYPLDKVVNWNRLYGKKGFFQYQCVVPLEDGKNTIQTMLNDVEKSGMVSPLAVIKTFGEIESKGMMSFPRKGVTLAMDFPNKAPSDLSLFDRFDDLVAEAGGAVYPAKDARMKAENFRRFFPRVEEFEKYIDPAFSSSFWQRVMG
ncbi:MAG: FAD-dependent oxidoreductase [Gammaproteobacteria bacterium]